jgi:hypothetical protein
VRRRRLAAAALPLATLLAGCGGHAAPTGHQLTGEYTVHGDYARRGGHAPGPGERCDAAAVGYPDIHAGTPATVRDAGGGVVATTALGEGRFRLSVLNGDDCVFAFAVKVPDSEHYQVEVGHRGATTFSRAELERAGWKAALVIGNYAPGI